MTFRFPIRLGGILLVAFLCNIGLAEEFFVPVILEQEPVPGSVAPRPVHSFE